MQLPSKAFLWFLRAADQGSVVGQFTVGNMYEHGEDVGQDYIKAYMYFDLAAAHKDDSEALVAAEHRNKLAQHMSKTQIAEAQKLAREWKAKPEQ